MRVLSRTNAFIKRGAFNADDFTPILIAGAASSNKRIQSYSMKMIERLIKEKKLDRFSVVEQLREIKSGTSQ